MDIITKLENTSKKTHSILMKAADYCVKRDCSKCILDNYKAEICTTIFIRRIDNKIKFFMRDKK